MVDKVALNKLTRARVALMLDKPFFGTLALKVQLIEDDTIPTAGVNSRELRYNPDFIASLSLPQTKGLVAHEVMHLVLMHNTRRAHREPGKWNSACDYAINPILVDDNFSLPEGGLLDDKYKGMSADVIYNMLPEQPPGAYGGGFGEVMDDAHGKTQAEISHIEAEAKIMVAEAAQVAKMQGKLPGHLAELVDSVMDAQVDWREKLRNFVNQIARNDYDWTRPSRRYEEFYWPRLYSEEAGKIAIALDTSGSISNREVSHFFGELNAIVDEVRPSTIEILDIDTRINQVRTFTPDEYPIDWKRMDIKGRGGTAFSPAFEHYKDKTEQPQCLIYLTDLYCDDFGEEPDYPVLWVSTSNNKDVPFGEVTRIMIDGT